MKWRSLISAFLMLSCLGLHAAPREHSVGTRLSYPLGSAGVNAEYKGNADALRVLDQVLGDGASVSRIVVKGVSSPDGPLSANRRVARQRAQLTVEFLKERYAGLPDSLFVVKTLDEDWACVENYLLAADKAWKDEALQIVRGAPAKRKALLQELWVGEAWDDLLQNAFPRMRRTEIQVVLEGDAAPGNRVLFRRGYRNFVQTDPGNAEILEEVGNKLRSGYAGPITLTGYASPDGSASANEKLSLARAQSLKDYLVKELSVPEDRIVLENGGVDWEGFAATVENSYYGTDKERVLEILRDRDLADSAKKRALIALGGGNTWKTLKKEQMPLLCAVDVSFEGSGETVSDATPEEPSVVTPPPEEVPEVAPEVVPEEAPEEVPEEAPTVVPEEPVPEVILQVEEEAPPKPAVEPELVTEQEPD